MNNFEYNLVIIGGGSAGSTAAMVAASLKKKVLIIEKGLLGGTCTNVGCVPSKSYLHAAGLLRNLQVAKSYGLTKNHIQGDILAQIKKHKNRLIENMRSSGEQVMKKAGIEILKAKAKLAGKNTLIADNKKITAEHILIATGASPFVPPIEGLSGINYLTSTSALELDNAPASIIIIGGAYIGLEFAAFFNALGTKTTIIEAMQRLAPNEDREISEYLQSSFEKQGIDFFVNTKVLTVNKKEKQVVVKAEKDGEQISLTAEKILVATGRAANFSGLNLEQAGVIYGRKGIEVSEYLQSSTPSIYAAGDVLPPPSLQLEHVAVYEGNLAVKNMFLADKQAADYRVVPRVMFSHPEVASVGETEEQASSHASISTFSYPYRAIAMAYIGEDTQGLIKLVADSTTKELLGAHIIGQDAGNLIHLAAMAMQFNLPIDKVADSVPAYPTLAQGFYYAAENLNEKISQEQR